MKDCVAILRRWHAGVVALALVLGGVAAGDPAAGDPARPVADSPLRGTYWKLVRLLGQPVLVADNQREPHLVFGNDHLRVTGSGGCNHLSGGFELAGDTLRLGQLGGGMMACPQGMAQEQRFLQTLARVQRYRVAGSRLDMLDAAGAVIARFEAVALP